MRSRRRGDSGGHGPYHCREVDHTTAAYQGKDFERIGGMVGAVLLNLIYSQKPLDTVDTIDIHYIKNKVGGV
jgi:hypothetical protein